MPAYQQNQKRHWVISRLYVFFVMMKTLKLTLMTLMAVLSCSPKEMISPFPEVIPFPQNVELSEGSFDVSAARIICSDDLDSLSRSYVFSFKDQLSAVCNKTGGAGAESFSRQILHCLLRPPVRLQRRKTIQSI